MTATAHRVGQGEIAKKGRKRLKQAGKNAGIKKYMYC
jgi:hypothetical protein